MSEDINIGAITEALNDKTDRDMRNVDNAAGADAVIEYQMPTADNNYTWYRLYASGWVEQGGQASVSQSASTTVSLPITMANTTFYVNFNTTDTADGASVSRSTRITSASQIELRLGYGSNLTRNGVWEVKGMAAQGA